MSDPGRVFAALADPHRRFLVEALATRESATPTELASELPVTRQAVSKHLAALADAEDRLALVGRRSAFAAQSGVFARVLAGMSASAAQHAVALGDTGKLP